MLITQLLINLNGRVNSTTTTYMYMYTLAHLLYSMNVYVKSLISGTKSYLLNNAVFLGTANY